MLGKFSYLIFFGERPNGARKLWSCIFLSQKSCLEAQFKIKIKGYSGSGSFFGHQFAQILDETSSRLIDWKSQTLAILLKSDPFKAFWWPSQRLGIKKVTVIESPGWWAQNSKVNFWVDDFPFPVWWDVGSQEGPAKIHRKKKPAGLTNSNCFEWLQGTNFQNSGFVSFRRDFSSGDLRRVLFLQRFLGQKNPKTQRLLNIILGTLNKCPSFLRDGQIIATKLSLGHPKCWFSERIPPKWP